MAVRTKWNVTHACGHDQAHDISARQVAERAGDTRWLARRDCWRYWTTQQDRETSKALDASLVERRTEKYTTIGLSETRAAIGGLDGSDEAVEWVWRVRQQFFLDAHIHEIDDNDFADRIEEPAPTMPQGTRWIDQSDAESAYLEEFFADSALEELAPIDENPR